MDQFGKWLLEELEKREAQLRRTEQAYDAGAYTPAEYADKRKALTARRDELQDTARQEIDAQRRAGEREKLMSSMMELLPVIHEWVATEEPRKVNYHLARVVELTVSPDKKVKAKFL